MPFFNRHDELAALEERWNSRRAEFFILYGRRRVGKSVLLAHFAENRRHLLFEATAGSERDHLDDLSREIARVSGRRLYDEQPLTSWRAVFEAFTELLEDGRTLIVLDEFQHIARRNAEIGSLINEFMRRHQDDPRLRLVIAGSDVSFFEDEVVGYNATVYGRRTGSLDLQPFGWREVAPFVPGWAVEDQVRVWAVFGGMPYYLNEVNPQASLVENILKIILFSDGLLRDEPTFLLAQESRIRDRDVYMSTLRAIAGGHTRLGEIAARINREPANTRTYLDTLERMHLVARRYPVTQSSQNKAFYAITDPFLRFWFRFVAPFESRLQTRGQAQRHLDETVLPQLDQFVSRDAFEEVCQGWALDNIAAAADVGRWWGNKRVRAPEGLRSRQYEADVVPIDADGKVLALGSCKWSINAHEASELDNLEQIADMLCKQGLTSDAGLTYMFFDKTGFSDRLQTLARDRSDIRLVLTAEM